MERKQVSLLTGFGLLFLLVGFLSCTGGTGPARPVDKEIVVSPEEIDNHASEIIRQSIEYGSGLLGKIDDSIQLAQLGMVNAIYTEKNFTPLWSRKQEMLQVADSLIAFLATTRNYGLFPADYHAHQLQSIRYRIEMDTSGKESRQDAALWARTDLMLTDAFVNLIHDLKWGRLQPDSITLREDTVATADFYQQQFNKFSADSGQTAVTQFLQSFEPVSAPYALLKSRIPEFIAAADFSKKEKLPFPVTDSAALLLKLQDRLHDLGYLDSVQPVPDSAFIQEGLTRFQKDNKLTADGKWGPKTASTINTSDEDRFLKLAITLDKYKLFPDSLPEQYVLVNIPGYYLELWKGDSVELWSRVVVGKPNTRTPELNSALSELVTYPQWTIPTSIIQKEILPGIKKNPDYLAKKGYSLVSYQGEEIDPYMVDWSKYSKGVPFKVVQGSGDANALGILKFNFRNKYSVYLHDTNQRYLFSESQRALSHGCVRVKQWEDLMDYLLQNDIEQTETKSKAEKKMDSVYTWLARKEKHAVSISHRMPLYIRYFTCAVQNGKLTFFDDVYGVDDRIRQRFFAGK